MQRDLWLLPQGKDVTVRLRNVPCGIYRDLVRRAVAHNVPFTLSDGLWPQALPASYLRVIRRFGTGAVITFIFDPDGSCSYLDVPEPGVGIYYSGPIGPEEMSDRVLANVSEFLGWSLEG